MSAIRENSPLLSLNSHDLMTPKAIRLIIGPEEGSISTEYDSLGYGLQRCGGRFFVPVFRIGTQTVEMCALKRIDQP